MTNRCNTCKHWVYPLPTHSFAKRQGLGECVAVMMLWDATRWVDDGESREFAPEHAGKKAFVQDGSDYTAFLYTVADFGCVQHEAKCVTS